MTVTHQITAKPVGLLLAGVSLLSRRAAATIATMMYARLSRTARYLDSHDKHHSHNMINLRPDTV